MSERKSVLSEAEAARVQAEFRAELEAEHVTRQEAQVRREERSQTKLKARQHERQVLAEEQLKEKIRAEFHREKGYQLYTDSAGREHWLTPQEYEWRMRMRAHPDSRRNRFDGSQGAKRRTLMMYGGAALLAIVIGLILIK